MISGNKKLQYPFINHMTVVYPLPRLNTLQWLHNGCDSVSNHQPHDCFLNPLFRHRSKKTSKLRVTGFCAGNSPEAGEFPAQMASNAENVSIWWRHHEKVRPLGWCSGEMLTDVLIITINCIWTSNIFRCDRVGIQHNTSSTGGNNTYRKAHRFQQFGK